MKAALITLGAWTSLVATPAFSFTNPAPRGGSTVGTPAYVATIRGGAGGSISGPALGALDARFAEPGAAGTGLLERLFFNETSGTRLNDSSGNGCAATIPPGGPTLSNGGLSFTAGKTAAVPLPACVTGVKTIEVVVAGGVLTPRVFGAPLRDGYPTMLGYAAGAGVSLQAAQTYAGVSAQQGYGTHWLQYHQSGARTQTLAAAIDNGLHVVGLVMDPAGPAIRVYLDGVRQGYTLAPAAAAAISLSGITWELGGSTATSGCTVTNCGWGGGIYGAAFSATAYSAAQMAQDSAAWHYAMQAKGVSSSRAFGLQTAQEVILGGDESVGSGHGLSNQATMNFEYLAARGMNAAYPTEHWFGIANGADNGNGYDIALDCPVEANAVEQGATLKFFVFNAHANTASEGTGAYATGNTTYPGLAGATDRRNYIAVAQEAAARDVQALRNCMGEAPGWHGIIATAIGGPAVASGAIDYDPIVRQPYNATIRTLAAAAGLIVFDPANETRFGADQAGASAAAAAGCSGGPCYQTRDDNHPTIAGQTVLADELEAVIADWRQSRKPRTATEPAALIMENPDIAGYFRTGHAVTLRPCGGLPNGTRMATIQNTGDAAITISTSDEYLGRTLDQIDGAPTYDLPAGAQRSFRVMWDGVAGDECGFTASNR